MDTEHERRLAAFQTERPKMIIALDKASGEVVYFPTDDVPSTKNDKNRYRAHVREHLACVVSSCSSDLTAVFRDTGTSHFRHLEAPAHEPESLLHHMGKRVIAHWAASKPGWTAEVEKPAPDGTCRPDVTLTAADGQQTVAEVQYSHLHPEVFKERNTRHVANAYAGRAWLLGKSTRYYFRRKDGRLRVRGLGRQILDSNGAVLLWLDPERREVTTAYDTGDRYGPRHPVGDYADALETVSLDECEPDLVYGVLTPRLKKIRDADLLRTQAEARRVAQIEEERRAAEEHAAARRAEFARRRDDWERSSDRTWVLHKHGDRLPDVIASARPEDQVLADNLEVLPVRWKARVYRGIASSKRQLEWKQVCGILLGLRRGTKLAKPEWQALSRFVEQLADRGMIAYDRRIPTIAGPPDMRLIRITDRPPASTVAPTRSLPAAPPALTAPVVIQTLSLPVLPPVPLPTEADLQASALRHDSRPVVTTSHRRGLMERVRDWWRR